MCQLLGLAALKITNCRRFAIFILLLLLFAFAFAFVSLACQSSGHFFYNRLFFIAIGWIQRMKKRHSREYNQYLNFAINIEQMRGQCE